MILRGLAVGLLMSTTLLSAGPSVAKGIKLADEVVTVVGVADIGSVGQSKARIAAIQNALSQAVAQALGTYIESTFSVQQKETLKNEKSEFLSRVEEQVKTKTKGLVSRYKVVSESQDGKLYRVNVQAKVRKGPLKDALAKLRALLSEVGNPKVMVLTGERYTDQFNKTKWIDRPTILTEIEKVLISRDFEMVDKSHTPEKTKLNETLGDAQKAALVAAQFGADVAIVGSAEVKHTAYNEMGNSMYYVSAVLNIRAVNVNTGKVMTSAETVGRGVGANEDIARIKAVRRGAPKLTRQILESLVSAWEKEAANGKRFRVSVTNVTHYRKVARPFLKFIKKLDKVAKVKEVSFKGDTLLLDVYFKGSKETLLDTVFDAADTNDKFSNLDKKADSGDSIELKL
ncbi:MAG: flagellar assembly protein T N-terminal domain-containing protein [Myxococcota bacterium]|nr:flagellar assembly protein T N-terminal domain-containing protein [Myxococcota bacterium]